MKYLKTSSDLLGIAKNSDVFTKHSKEFLGPPMTSWDLLGPPQTLVS